LSRTSQPAGSGGINRRRGVEETVDIRCPVQLLVQPEVKFGCVPETRLAGYGSGEVRRRPDKVFQQFGRRIRPVRTERENEDVGAPEIRTHPHLEDRDIGLTKHRVPERIAGEHVGQRFLNRAPDPVLPGAFPTACSHGA